jgi:hypothetical protein
VADQQAVGTGGALPAAFDFNAGAAGRDQHAAEAGGGGDVAWAKGSGLFADELIVLDQFGQWDEAP